MTKKKRKKADRDSRGGHGQARSQRINTRKSELMVAAAQDAWKRQQFERAISMYQEALRRDPRNAELMVDIARAYGLRQDFETAQEYVERALRSDPRRARIQYLAGETYWMISRLDEAAACFRRVLELNPDSPDAPAAPLRWPATTSAITAWKPREKPWIGPSSCSPIMRKVAYNEQSWHAAIAIDMANRTVARDAHRKAPIVSGCIRRMV